MNKNIQNSIAVGQTYGRLTVKAFAERRNDKAYWFCDCSCGTENHKTDVYSLIHGATSSCGCLARERASQANLKHGGSKGYRVERLYRIWQHMKDRCNNQNNEWFHNYGGRGIRVCATWETDYIAFRGWALSHGYAEGLTIERREVNGHYEPDNCLWIPKAEQSGNTRRSLGQFTAFGESKKLFEWAQDPRCIVNYPSLLQRIKRGWHIEQALTAPIQRQFI